MLFSWQSPEEEEGPRLTWSMQMTKGTFQILFGDLGLEVSDQLGLGSNLFLQDPPFIIDFLGFLVMRLFSVVIGAP